jgi:CheY-like chemotaxis protein
MDAAAGGGSPPVNKTILVVEDELALGKMLCMVLRRDGFQAYHATDGAQAIELYKQHGPAIDLVLMDVRMPGKDGVQTLEVLQGINPRVRCCFMSGETGHYTIPVLLEKGAIDVLLKPFYDLTALKQTLHSMIFSEAEV